MKKIMMLRMLVALLLLGSSIIFLQDFILKRSTYRFGTEIAGWAYRSEANYVFLLIFELVASVVATVLSIIAAYGAEKPSRIQNVFYWSAVTICIAAYAFL